MQQAGVRLVVNGMELDVADDANVLLTRAIDNISNPGERQAGYSTTITLPGTDNNHRVFGHIYDLQVDEARVVPYRTGAYLDESGQPQRIAYVSSQNNTCEVQIDGLTVFRGVLRLEKIVQRPRRVVQYEVRVELVGASWVQVLDGTNLRDLPDWQTSDTFRNDRVLATRDYDGSDAVTHKYLYPLVDYSNLTAHVNNGAASPVVPMAELRPAVFARAVLHSMFSLAGYSIAQDGLDTDELRGLLLPLTEEWTTDSTFGGITYRYYPDPTLSFWTGDSTFFYWDLLGIGERLTNPQFVLEFENTGTDTVSFTIRISATELDVLNGASLAPGEKRTFIVDGTPEAEQGGAATYLFQLVFATPVALTQELTWRIDRRGSRAVQPFPALALFAPESQFKRNSLLPDISCLEFLQALIRLFNLYVDTDEVRKTVSIYPRNTYLLPPPLTKADAVDWTDKVDEETDLEQEFTARELPVRIIYAYDQLGGNQEESYERTFSETFGSLTVDNSPTALADESSVEPGFASATTVRLSYDSGNKAISCIRLTTKAPADLPAANEYGLQRCVAMLHRHSSQTISVSGNTDAFGTVPASVSYASAPCAVFVPNDTGDVPLPQSLAYGEVNGLPGLYSIFYAEQIEQLRFSRKLRMAFYLTPKDILTLNFRKPVRVDNQDYYLQLVDQFDAKGTTTTTVELVKLVSVIPTEATPAPFLGDFNTDFSSDFSVF